MMILLLMMQDAYEFFNEVFLSTGIAGYFGPLGVIIIGYYLAKKEQTLGVLWFVVECLIIYNYLVLIETTPEYWWQVLIILVGGVLPCAFLIVDRKR